VSHTYNLEKFISDVQPIIINNIKKYSFLIDGYDYDDLLQEGVEASLKALNSFSNQHQFKKCSPDQQLLFWVKRNIQDRFKTLTKKSHLSPYMYSIDDDGSRYLADDSVKEIIDMILTSGASKRSTFETLRENEEGNSSRLSEKILNNICTDKDDKSVKKSLKKYLIEVLSMGLSPGAVAKELGVTESRISQLKSDLNILNYK